MPDRKFLTLLSFSNQFLMIFDKFKNTRKDENIMPDMLVKLYSLPKINSNSMEKIGVTIRKPLSSEKSKVIDWVRKHFSSSWADECEVTFSHFPISTYIAIAKKEIIGFAS